MVEQGLIVVGAFEPFGGRRVNRAWAAVSRLEPRPGLETVRLPVDFARLADVVPALKARGAAALLLVGEAARRRALSVEAVALNLIDARIPDNAGARPCGVALHPDGPLALAATWNTEAACRAAAAAGVRVELSHHAGTYACNAALYHALAAAVAPVVGFLHVPTLGWPLGPTTRAITRAIQEVILTLGHERDTDSRAAARR